MNQRDPLTTSASADIAQGQSPGRADPAESERLAHALSMRFAAHLQAAAAAVREAEQDLATAREELTRARQAAASWHYQSDRLVFMRASLKDEVEALGRKTTDKKLKTAYRYLVDRAVELAEGEVHGYHEDQAATRRDQEHSVEAWLETERVAIERLDAARAMQARVHDAEQTARQGLAAMVQKLKAQAQPKPNHRRQPDGRQTNDHRRAHLPPTSSAWPAETHVRITSDSEQGNDM